MESCDICGDDLRRYCSQGHGSGAGKLFCNTCGELLPSAADQPAMAAAAPLTMDYSSGSFSDFIASTEERLGWTPGPRPETPPVVLVDPPGLPAPDPAPDPAAEPAPLAGLVPESQGAEREDDTEAGQEPEAEPEPELPVPFSVWEGRTRDLRFPAPAHTWRSSTTPRDAPGPDGGVHHDDGPHLAAETDPQPERQPRRRSRGQVIAIVVLAAAVGAAGVVGALALHQHYAPRLTAPLGPAEPAVKTAPGSAAGASGSAGGTSPAAAPTQSAGLPGWTSPFPVLPLSADAHITGMSCPSTSACFAVDSAGQVLSSTPPAGWRKTFTDASSGLVAISCGTPVTCVALDHSGRAVTFSHGTWSGPAMVDAGTGTFTGLSCPTATFCMATDSRGSAFARTPTGWQQFTVDASGGRLTGVSCANTGFCVAVGNGGRVYSYDGRSWAAVSAIDAGHSFTAVSCATAGFCVAVDNSGNAAAFNHGTWNVRPMGSPVATVSCPVRGFCMATSTTGGTMAYSDGKWSPLSVVDGTTAVNALSCARPTFCVAADHRGDVLYYRPK